MSPLADFLMCVACKEGYVPAGDRYRRVRQAGGLLVRGTGRAGWNGPGGQRWPQVKDTDRVSQADVHDRQAAGWQGPRRAELPCSYPGNGRGCCTAVGLGSLGWGGVGWVA